jgi:hypothetical protein
MMHGVNNIKMDIVPLIVPDTMGMNYLRRLPHFEGCSIHTVKLIRQNYCRLFLLYTTKHFSPAVMKDFRYLGILIIYSHTSLHNPGK